MSMAWSERARRQIEQPLQRRSLPFAIVSVLVLFPLSLVWSYFSARRVEKRKKNMRPEASQPWIVSVGNVAVGGTGKSPVVRALARLAFAQGFDVAILARGAGQSSASLDGIKICSLPSAAGPDAVFSGEIADELLEHALALQSEIPLGAQLWLAQSVQRDRAALAVCDAREKEMSRSGEASKSTHVRQLMILLDDGLSQYRLPVHRDVIVWDPQTLLTSPRVCLPFGPYRMGRFGGREWADSLPRADMCVWSRLSPDNEQDFLNTVQAAQNRLLGRDSLNGIQTADSTQANDQVAIERTWMARARMNEPEIGFSLEMISEADILGDFSVLTGIARPQRFLQSVDGWIRRSGVKCVVSRIHHLADHAKLNADSEAFIRDSQRILITLKDLCRWWKSREVQRAIRSERVYVLCLEVDLSPVDLQSELPASATLDPLLRVLKGIKDES